MSAMTNSKIFNAGMPDTQSLPKADGAFGLRKISRGLAGFWHPERQENLTKDGKVRQRRRPIDGPAQMLVQTAVHGQPIGFTIRRAAR